MMKKYLFLLLTLLVTSLAFVSCSDDDDDNQYNSAIVGTWKVTEVKQANQAAILPGLSRLRMLPSNLMAHITVPGISEQGVALGQLRATR